MTELDSNALGGTEARELVAALAAPGEVPAFAPIYESGDFSRLISLKDLADSRLALGLPDS